ncbi:glycosyltransferase 87 family protein [Streptomyces sp. GS7]|uniref:glycosyltransferase 87 family protein n=1 Tax=Streptomyces sp. GS7 TaxID=2692234 RepID=UPI001F300567|nr:glycosyltransferase 87 family protein [Streptomyces sp. GS7]
MGWSACALTALGLGIATTLAPHRTWALIATVGYGCAAAVAAFRARGRNKPRAPAASAHLPAVVAVTGSVVLPLAVLALSGRAQLEVSVVERAGGLLLSSGSPYVPTPSVVPDYNPYLPGMAVFGLPHALFGARPLADARWWMAGAFLLSMTGAALTLVRGVPAGLRAPRRSRVTARRNSTLALAWLAACPMVALPLAVGGIDLPVIGLMCWGLAAAGRGMPGRTGLLLGAAAALKWTAWPAIPVAIVLLVMRNGWRRGLTCGAVTAVTVSATVLPFALTTPRSFAENVVAFPLGLGATASPAESPLPGHLLAAYVPGGRLTAMALLAVAALTVVASLLVRPPCTVRTAADRLAIGLALAMALMPATRFGYLVYPLVLCVWPRLCRPAVETRTASRLRMPEPPPLENTLPADPATEPEHHIAEPREKAA